MFHLIEWVLLMNRVAQDNQELSVELSDRVHTLCLEDLRFYLLMDIREQVLEKKKKKKV